MVIIKPHRIHQLYPKLHLRFQCGKDFQDGGDGYIF